MGKEHPRYTPEYLSRLANTPVKTEINLEGLNQAPPIKVRYTPEYLTKIASFQSKEQK